LILGWVAIIHVEGSIFGDDRFELGFNAGSILFAGQFNKFINLAIEPVEVVAVPFQNKDLFVTGLNDSFPFVD